MLLALRCSILEREINRSAAFGMHRASKMTSWTCAVVAVKKQDRETEEAPSPIYFLRHSNQIIDTDPHLNGGATTLHVRKTSRLVDSAPRVASKPLRLVNAVRPADQQWRLQGVSLGQLPNTYLMLSKFRLTGLVVLTELAGYAMAPGQVDWKVFAVAAIGTGLTSCAANSFNQFFEAPYDAQMVRTRNRVLVRGMVSPLHVVTFGTVCATLGIASLALYVNWLTATLGALNLFLYTLVYTPMKRYSILNTWLGSVVGAIPPAMGWAACTGALEPGALLMGGVLFAWQFPHFNALSWNLRADYSKAGYRMMSVTDPGLCRRTALRYSVAMVALCTLAPVVDLTTWTFAVDSLPVNAVLVYLSWRFYKDADSASARRLFRFSLIHLPALMMLMLVSKKTFGAVATVTDSVIPLAG